MFSRHHIIWLVMLIFVTGLLASCQPPSPPRVSEIQAQPSTTILVDETASLTVEASGGDLKFEWTVVRGSLSDPTQPSVIYTAPNTPGPDTVTVEVSSGGATTVQSITFQVVGVTPPSLSPSGTPAPSPMATLTPTPSTLCSWNGTPGDPNSGVVSAGEAIWRDASDDDTGDGDYSYPGDDSVSKSFWGTSAADIEEFRVKADGQSICLMIRVADIPDEAVWIPHLAVYINNDFPQSSTQTDLAESVEAHTPSDWTWEYIIVLESETVEVFDVFHLWDPRSEGVVGRMDPVSNVYEVRLPMTSQAWTGVGNPAGKEWGFLLWVGLSDRGEAREVLVAPDRDYPGGGNFGPDREADGTLIQNADPDIFDLIGSVQAVQEGDLATYAEGSSALIDESWIWVLFDADGMPSKVRSASNG